MDILMKYTSATCATRNATNSNIGKTKEKVVDSDCDSNLFMSVTPVPPLLLCLVRIENASTVRGI